MMDSPLFLGGLYLFAFAGMTSNNEELRIVDGG